MYLMELTEELRDRIKEDVNEIDGKIVNSKIRFYCG